MIKAVREDWEELLGQIENLLEEREQGLQVSIAFITPDETQAVLGGPSDNSYDRYCNYKSVFIPQSQGSRFCPCCLSVTKLLPWP